MFPFWTKTDPKPEQTRGAVLSDLIALHATGQASWSSRAPGALMRQGYARNPVVYRCVQMISEAASSVPVHLVESQVPVVDHPLAALLKKPNPDQSAQDFFECLYGYLQVGGNAYIEVIQGTSHPVALYLLKPDEITVEPGPDGWPLSYLHKIGAKSRRLYRQQKNQSTIIHISLFNPADSLKGQSPLAVAADAIDLHNAATAWNKALLDNAARPSGALIYKGPEGATNLTGEQFDRLKKELADAYQGFSQAGRPMVLDGGLDWRPMSMSPAEMDFRELKHGAARDIALAFGVPPMLLGIPGDNTYSNYQQANLAFWRQTVLPLVGKVSDALSAGLADEGLGVKYDADHIDALHQSRLERLRIVLESDVLSTQEKRLALGYPAEETSV